MDPPSAIAAAVILGDKTDVNHSRVRYPDVAYLDMHARVNYACQRAFLRVSRETKTISSGRKAFAKIKSKYYPTGSIPKK